MRTYLSCYRGSSTYEASREIREEIMAKSEQTGANLSPAQETLRQLWEEHVRYEFSTRNTEDTLATMVEDAYVNHIPVLTGGVGQDELREFYSKRFIPQMPPDTEMTPVSRTIGEDQLVHEHIYWDQASVLAQIGLIDAAILPVAGVESARKVLDPTLPANALMRRADRSQ